MSALDAAKRLAIASAYLREPSSAVAARFDVHQSTVIRVCHELDLVKRAGAGGAAATGRRREIGRLRREHFTLEEIGERLGGISKQRVSQILNPPVKVRPVIVVGSGVKWPRRAAGEEYWRRGWWWRPCRRASAPAASTVSGRGPRSKPLLCSRAGSSIGPRLISWRQREQAAGDPIPDDPCLPGRSPGGGVWCIGKKRCWW